MNSAELLERLRAVDPAAIADANKEIRVISAEIRPIQTNVQMLGRAYTVQCDSDFLSIIAALEEAQPGDVLIVDTQASDVAVVGELFSLEANRLGLAGIVVDGAVRDISVIRSLAMPVYSRSITPVSGTVNELSERQIPVNCGGVEVNPGDIIFGDDDGIIVGSEAEFSALIAAAEGIKKTEIAAIDAIGGGQSLLSLLNFAEHRERITAGDTTSRLQFKI